MQVRRCEKCALLFRYPKDDQQENKSFYQRKYRQDTVTDLPRESDIPQHIATRFRSVGRDLTEHLATMKPISPAGRLLDYGCSWGYCVHQFREAGYEARGFEISEPRVAYGRAVLGVDLTSNLDELPDRSFDVIYAAHVLEHIPDPAISFRTFQRLLAPGGKVFIYVPNSGGKEARALGIHWPPMVNEKHVLALTAEFFAKNLPAYGFDVRIASSPYSEPARAHEESPNVDGEELLVVAERIS
jgi:2-polyprenyl-3-methyl-5-hydroxy-6-metoxy-1,4-benzoquinol methylase